MTKVVPGLRVAVVIGTLCVRRWRSLHRACQSVWPVAQIEGFVLLLRRQIPRTLSARDSGGALYLLVKCRQDNLFSPPRCASKEIKSSVLS